ncbi:thiol reductant ABC exporter subunit CydC [Sanguibacter sp. HDW7]|uniref:thiol reductant ABC exporter subunit CydC n=1 Tax=Sanguibacter sp. HDW7 TaxID=2714931 RepID=UPI00140E0D77|nr:thiol reductant ABC exporter subunit CydC [Sanguibacter sp. HDW7]QIK83889.1 thiol reductant ABC exporter subunit CydC [Sanguibacter sp. HDW7]
MTAPHVAPTSAAAARPTTRHRDPLRRVLPLLEVSPARALAAVGLGSLALGSALALAAVSAWLIARASQMPPVLTLSVATVGVRTFGIGRGLFRYLERIASHEVALRGVAALRTNLYRVLAGGRLDAVAGLRRGDLLARTGQDADTVGDVVVRALVPAGVAVVLSCGAVVTVGVFLPSAALVLALCLLVAGVVSPWLTARATRASEIATVDARARVTDASLTLLEDSAFLRVSGALPAERARLRTADAEMSAARDRTAAPLAVAAAIADVAVGVALLGALVLGIPAVGAGTLAPVELAVVALVPLAAFEATSLLPAAAVQLHRSRAAAARIAAVLDASDPDGSVTARVLATPATADAPAVPGSPTTEPRDDADVTASGTTAPDAPTSTTAVPAGPRLAASAASCAWPGRSPVVEGLDLEVAPGRVVALVGPSGVGKTTALLTLGGLLEPAAGTVESPVGASIVTTEDAHVFATSVLENLRVARGTVSEDEATATLGMLGLGPWLGALPDGLGTLLGPGGATVSGGERRRLLLARAVLADAPLLLVDEPAEHVEPTAADELVTDVLPRLAAAGRGVVVATHRLTPLEAVDEVVVLALPDPVPGTAPGTDGTRPAARVVARGTHAFLLDHLPAYRTAWDLERAEAR